MPMLASTGARKKTTCSVATHDTAVTIASATKSPSPDLPSVRAVISGELSTGAARLSTSRPPAAPHAYGSLRLDAPRELRRRHRGRGARGRLPADPGHRGGRDGR